MKISVFILLILLFSTSIFGSNIINGSTYIDNYKAFYDNGNVYIISGNNINKYDKDLNLKQTARLTFGAEGYRVDRLISTSDGGCIVIGGVSRFVSSVSYTLDGCIAKLDSKLKCENVIYFSYGSMGRGSYVNDIIRTRDNNFVVVGGDVRKIWSDFNELGGGDAFILKVDKNLKVLSKNIFGNNGFDWFVNVVELSDGNILAYGSTTRTKDKINISSSVVVKYTANLKKICSQNISTSNHAINTSKSNLYGSYNDSSYDYTNKIIAKSDGGFYLLRSNNKVAEYNKKLVTTNQITFDDCYMVSSIKKGINNEIVAYGVFYLGKYNVSNIFNLINSSFHDKNFIFYLSGGEENTVDNSFMIRLNNKLNIIERKFLIADKDGNARSSRDILDVIPLDNKYLLMMYAINANSKGGLKFLTFNSQVESAPLKTNLINLQDKSNKLDFVNKSNIEYYRMFNKNIAEIKENNTIEIKSKNQNVTNLIVEYKDGSNYPITIINIPSDSKDYYVNKRNANIDEKIFSYPAEPVYSYPSSYRKTYYNIVDKDMVMFKIKTANNDKELIGIKEGKVNFLMFNFFNNYLSALTLEITVDKKTNPDDKSNLNTMNQFDFMLWGKNLLNKVGDFLLSGVSTVCYAQSIEDINRATPDKDVIGYTVKYGLVDKAGKLIIDYKYDNPLVVLNDMVYVFERATLFTPFKYGVMTLKEKRIFPKEYNEPPFFINNMYVIEDDFNNKVNDKYYLNRRYDFLDKNYKKLYFFNKDEVVTSYYMDFIKRENSKFVVFYKDKFGVVTLDKKIIVPVEYDDIRVCSGKSIFLCNKDNKYDLYNDVGKKLNDTSYQNISYEKDKYFIATLEKNKYLYDVNFNKLFETNKYDDIIVLGDNLLFAIKDDKIGIIDFNGKEILPLVYTVVDNSYSSHKSSLRYAEKSILKKDNLLYYINTFGRVMPVYSDNDSANIYNNNKKYKDNLSYKGDRGIYYHKAGYTIDLSKRLNLENKIFDNIISACEYTDIISKEIEEYNNKQTNVIAQSSDNRAYYDGSSFRYQDGIKWYYDNISKPVYRMGSYIEDDVFERGNLKRYKNYRYVSIYNSYCVYDENFNIVIPDKYSYIEDMKNGFFKVYDINNKVGIVDKNNNIVCPIKYDYISSFYSDLVVVGMLKDNTYYYGLLNSTGKDILPVIYDEIYNFNGNYTTVKLKGKYGVINKQGKFIVPLKNDYDRLFVTYWGTIMGYKNKMFCMIDKNGKKASSYYTQIISPRNYVSEKLYKITFRKDMPEDKYLCVGKLVPIKH